MSKEPKIFVSNLTIPPRYYLAFSYKQRTPTTVVITGKKWDITDQIREIVSGMGHNK